MPLEHFKDYNFVEGKDLSTELGVLKKGFIFKTFDGKMIIKAISNKYIS